MAESDDRPGEEALARGREAYAARAWADAYLSLEQADQQTPLSQSDLERLVWAAVLSGRIEQMISGIERLHQALHEQQQLAAAARWAFWAGFRLNALGETGRAGAWFTRAQRCLAQLSEECAEHGYMMLPSALRQMNAGDYLTGFQIAGQALAIAERFGDRDLAAFARTIQGRNLVRQNQVSAGLSLMDEAMLAATGGELSAVMTGVVYCAVIAGCNQAFALDRAREWTQALDRFCRMQPQMLAFNASCMVNRAELMQQSGEWEHAACEALRAIEPEHRGVEPQAVAEAYYQHAEILRLRGEVEQAEEAYRNASQMGRDPQPGLSLLRLQQARVDAAAQTIRRVMSQTELPLLRARYFPAFCEIMLAAGAHAEAEQGADELEQIAAHSSSEILSAMAAQVRGAQLLAKGELQPALMQLRAALDVWQRVAAPYIAARVRVLLARGYRAVGDEDGALLELDAARQVFTKLGAAPDLAQLTAAPACAPTKSPHNLSPRELEVLRHVATGKTNKLIARALGLSEKTVDRHVSNILTKIDAPSRAAATAFAYEHGLVSPATEG